MGLHYKHARHEGIDSGNERAGSARVCLFLVRPQPLARSLALRDRHTATRVVDAAAAAATAVERLAS